MTPSSKLIGASSLLVVGYAVASFVGSPAAPYLPRAGGTMPSEAVAPSSVSLAPLPPAGPTTAAADGHSAVSRRASDGSDRALPPATAGTVQPASLPVEVSTPPLLDSASSDFQAAPLPRATLKDAQVRSLSMGPDDENSAAVVIGSPPLLPPGEVNAASYLAEATSERVAAGASAAEPPSPRDTPLRAAGPRGADHYGQWRAHIVKDGDSLEKLARRYLGDESHSGEIFELNRGLLADPGLLPIGMELTIPPRSRPNPEAAIVPQNAERAADAATASAQGSTPVRPVPAESSVTPRAKLLRPLPAGR